MKSHSGPSTKASKTAVTSEQSKLDLAAAFENGIEKAWASLDHRLDTTPREESWRALRAGLTLAGSCTSAAIMGAGATVTVVAVLADLGESLEVEGAAVSQTHAFRMEPKGPLHVFWLSSPPGHLAQYLRYLPEGTIKPITLEAFEGDSSYRKMTMVSANTLWEIAQRGRTSSASPSASTGNATTVSALADLGPASIDTKMEVASTAMQTLRETAEEAYAQAAETESFMQRPAMQKAFYAFRVALAEVCGTPEDVAFWKLELEGVDTAVDEETFMANEGRMFYRALEAAFQDLPVDIGGAFDREAETIDLWIDLDPKRIPKGSLCFADSAFCKYHQGEGPGGTGPDGTENRCDAVRLCVRAGNENSVGEVVVDAKRVFGYFFREFSARD